MGLLSRITCLALGCLCLLLLNVASVFVWLADVVHESSDWLRPGN